MLWLKHQDPGWLVEERLYFGFWFQREAWQRAARVCSWALTSSATNPKERTNRKWVEAINSQSLLTVHSDYFLREGCNLKVPGSNAWTYGKCLSVKSSQSLKHLAAIVGVSCLAGRSVLRHAGSTTGKDREWRMTFSNQTPLPIIPQPSIMLSY